MSSNSYPRLRLIFWSREEGSALPPPRRLAHLNVMGEPTRGRRAEPSPRDQKLRRERGYEWEDTSNIVQKNNKKKKKKLARKKRRRGRAGRRAARQASKDRDGDGREELVIATHSVRTMAVDGKHGVGRAGEVLHVYQEMVCD